MPVTPDQQWKLTMDAATLKGHEAEATLALRLGLAIDCISAAFRFHLASADTAGPGGDRDRTWAFLIGAAYVHEARVLLSNEFQQIKALALKGGATEDEAGEISKLFSGNGTLGPLLARMRNKLVFNWDRELIRQSILADARGTVVWAEGIGSTLGASFFRGSADAVYASIFEDLKDATEGQLRFRQLAEDMFAAVKRLTRFFQHAIDGFLKIAGPPKWVNVAPASGARG